MKSGHDDFLKDSPYLLYIRKAQGLGEEGLYINQTLLEVLEAETTWGHVGVCTLVCAGGGVDVVILTGTKGQARALLPV